MSVLIIGGDNVNKISDVLKTLGVTKIKHWDARKKASACRKVIPSDTNCVVMLTSFLNHNAMKHFKIEAKKRNLPVVCSKQSVNCIYDEYVKIMNITNCDDCYASATCNMKK
ncbi:MAG: DUF2325 domain-containing protein [Arcobacteraceae bacterium]